ncbi:MULTISPECIES: COQ9 family protein [unclassified Novosphingobium]|uniref:COQ9 family protein n=1 Tax=unclassified Novosphingobium TaxID=2644732 RepID=UPI001447A412|nr:MULTISPECIES: COQ9 family protein [unclassified Novosphingobium]NKJ43489.1 ubiquinone biosynthesis protein COQ9 [Novosphingobium sp. SG720]NMN05984.1 ubiquinone biosynthesis protein COQ9 [Novosphingobium sp. SG919]NMN88280.1 ubiquinone biosynthesis protein COQ9 [Novosphingobium sp. SG916]
MIATPDLATLEALDLDQLRVELAPLVAEAAMFDGWTGAAVDSAAQAVGLDPAVARLAYGVGESGSAMTMIAAWIARIDADMSRALPAQDLAKLPIRERIRRLVQFRLDALAGMEEALRRALIEMARPRNSGQSLKLGWHSADAMWRLAGDTATDLNHYSKRATLAALYAATLAVFAEDRSEDHAETRAFLDRRIEGVMRFEKLKAGLFKRKGERFSPVRLLGRLRYPAR